MDEYNRPLYGDVFGVLPKASDFQEVRCKLTIVALFLPVLQAGEPIEREAWGELEPDEGKHGHHSVSIIQLTYLLQMKTPARRRRRRRKATRSRKMQWMDSKRPLAWRHRQA
jgi:hypothetical protein